MEHYPGREHTEADFLWKDVVNIFKDYAFECGLQRTWSNVSSPDAPDTLVLSTHPDDDTENTVQIWRYFMGEEDIAIIKYVSKDTDEKDVEIKKYALTHNIATGITSTWSSELTSEPHRLLLEDIRKDVRTAKWDASWSQSVAVYETMSDMPIE